MVSIGGLPQCHALELIRVLGIDAKTVEWAIVGKKAPGYFPVVYLTGENAPFVLDATNAPFVNGRPVVKYGKAYRLEGDHRKGVEIAEPKKQAGRMLLAGEDWYLVVNKFNEEGQRWFHVKSGEVKGEPGDHHAEFEGWTLRVEGVGGRDTEGLLLAGGASNPK
jgi:hypothetical protein